MSDVNVSVLIGDEYRARLPELVKKISAAGLRVHQRLDDIGVITGVADAKALTRIANVQGVAKVERDRSLKALTV